MDAETSLAQQLLAAIPSRGATWGDIRRELPEVTVYALEGALTALKRSGLVVVRSLYHVGVWYRAGDAHRHVELNKVKPPLEVRQQRTEAARRVQYARRAARYDADGNRYCSGGQHYAPVNRFGRGSFRDGLHGWCKECRKGS